MTSNDRDATEAGPEAGAVGATVRRERLARGFTTRALAAAAGVSQPFLTNIENGRVMPSIASLYSIAGALGVSASALLPEQPVRQEIVRAGSGTRIALSDDETAGFSRMISGARGRMLEAYEFELRPGYVEDAPYSHAGEDFVMVLAGSLVYTYEGHADAELHEGDSVWIDATGDHTWSVPSEQIDTTRILLITAVSGGRAHRLPL